MKDVINSLITIGMKCYASGHKEAAICCLLAIRRNVKILIGRDYTPDEMIALLRKGKW